MKWRKCISYAAIHRAIESGKARSIPSASLSSQSKLSTVQKSMDYRRGDRAGSGDASIGGGAINEKPRLYQGQSNDGSSEYGGGGAWNPTDELSHMLHALVGLDRYPNYLGRFRDAKDIELLESALQSRLEDVRQQKSEILERRRGIRELVSVYLDVEGGPGRTSDLWSNHATFSHPKSWADLRGRNILQDQAFEVAHRSISKVLATKRYKTKSRKNHKQKIGATEEKSASPTVEDVIMGKVHVDLDPSLLEDWISQEMFDVYSFPLFTEEFCSLLRKTLRELSQLAESDDFSHLQLGRRNIDLDAVGLGWISDLIFHMFIKPISHHLFAETEQLVGKRGDGSGGNDSNKQPILDWRQGYVAGYSAEPAGSKGATRHRLVPHTDDSEVTLNCCMGEETFVGGDVEFFGLRGTPEEGQLIGIADRPNIGTALLHSGRHLHAVSNVSSGDRYALIVWCRSWGQTRSNTCPCCWLNRRKDSTCICSSRWN